MGGWVISFSQGFGYHETEPFLQVEHIKHQLQHSKASFLKLLTCTLSCSVGMYKWGNWYCTGMFDAALGAFGALNNEWHTRELLSV